MGMLKVSPEWLILKYVAHVNSFKNHHNFSKFSGFKGFFGFFYPFILKKRRLNRSYLSDIW